MMILTGCNNGAAPAETSGTAAPTDTSAPVQTEAPEPAKPDYDISDQYEWGNVEIVGGGYTVGLYYNKAEKGLLYARTDIGGFYRMDNSTGRWKPLTDQFGADDYSYYGIDGCAVDEKDPDKVYILAGMYRNMKAAVLCSDDRGDTWSITPLEFSCGGNEPNRQCDRLALDPNDNSTLYVGSRGDGLWVSHDSGASFAKVESFPTLGLGYGEDGYTFGITAVAFDPASSADGEPCKTIYAGTGDKTVYVSHDAGSTWEELSGAPAGLLTCHIYVEGGSVYLVMNDKSGPYQMSGGSVMKYDPAANEWSDITPPEKGHGWGDIEIDPADPKLLYVSTMGKWGANENDCIWRSTDGGASWEPIFTGDGDNRLFKVDCSGAPWLTWGSDHAKLGWMMGDIEIDPFNSDELIYGTGATIYRSTNLTKWGSETVNFEVRCAGLEETAVMTLRAANSDDIRLYSGMGDVDGFTHRDIDKVPEYMNGNGFMGATRCIACAYNAPEIAARTGDGNQPIAITQDGGKTWNNINRPKGVKGDCGTVEISCDGKIIYWTNKSAAAIYKTLDYGKTWEKVERAFASAKLAADCSDPDVLFVYTSGALYVTKDGCKSFKMCSSFIPDNCTPVADPDKSGDLWLATAGGGVYHVSDYGQGEVVRKNIQSAKAFAVGAPKDENSPMTLYAIGMNEDVNGVWRSTDSGDTWQKINDDKHQFGYIGDSMAADLRTFGQVYFGSNGRGILRGRERTES